MKPVRARIPTFYRSILYTVLTTSWITGVSLFILQKWIRVSSDFGLTYHPAQATMRQIHGAGAFLMMIIYGYLLASHVQYGWKQKRQRKLGLTLVILHFLLIISGYMVYYVGDDQLLQNVATFHIITGLTYPIILIGHIYLALKLRKKPKKKVAIKK